MQAVRVPTHIHFGPGGIRRVGGICRDLGWSRALLVMDPGLEATPWPARVADALTGSGLQVDHFQDIPANPRVATAEAAATRARAHRADGIVGLGGGSALDTAKGAALLATNPQPIRDLVDRRVFATAPLPVAAIPTTCGTGSEVTWVSVLTDPQTQTKLSVKGDALFPKAAVVDPDVLETLPSPLIAHTGMDALTHALEATVGCRRNPFTDALAEAAVARLLTHLEAATAHDRGALGEVMVAATLAGLAFGNADVGAVHCLSESIGGVFDTPHGLTNAVLLVAVLRDHGASIHGRLSDLQLATGLDAGDQVANAERLLDRVQALCDALDIPSLAVLGVPLDAIPRLATLAVANGSNGANPRPLGESDYQRILENAFRGSTGDG